MTRRTWVLLGALVGTGLLAVFIRARANNQSVGEFVMDKASSAAQMLTRGLRNNNPGNIRHGDKWQGMASTQTDKDFVTFTDPKYGIRAAAIILKNYKAKYGLDTIRGIVTRWAPPGENDTAAYISAVSRFTGIAPDTKLIYPQDLPSLIAALTKQENGVQPYKLAKIQEGVQLA